MRGPGIGGRHMAMLDSILRFVRERVTPAVEPGKDLESSGPRPVQLAACALLLELAHADGEFTEPERAHIEQSIVRHFGLDDATAAELIKLAELERRQSLDHFQFTRLIVQQFDLGQKMVLAELMWGVILADGKMSDHESHLVRKMASLMQLEPGYLAEARRKAAGE
jgi:uncharacterized tellurite resistance protein B-like protein